LLRDVNHFASSVDPVADGTDAGGDGLL